MVVCMFPSENTIVRCPSMTSGSPTRAIRIERRRASHRGMAHTSRKQAIAVGLQPMTSTRGYGGGDDDIDKGLWQWQRQHRHEVAVVAVTTTSTRGCGSGDDIDMGLCGGGDDDDIDKA